MRGSGNQTLQSKSILSYFAFLFFAFISGCASPYTQLRTAELLPQKNAAEWTDAQRFNPDDHIELTNWKYKRVIYNYDQNPDGINALVLPRTKSLEASWDYVFLARDFLNTGDYAAASRAYWEAISTGSISVASKQNKDVLKSVAYYGLFEIAVLQNKPKWAEILYLCHRLSKINSSTKDAFAENDLFYESLDAVVKTEQERVIAQNRINRQQNAAAFALAMQTLASGINAVNSGMASGLDQAQIQQQIFQNQLQALQGYQNISSSAEGVDQTLSKMKQAGDALADNLNMTINDVSVEIEAGKSFLGREVVSSLLSGDTKGVSAEVEAFAYDKPEILTIISQVKKYGDNFNRNTLVTLNDILKNYESDIVKKERFVKR